MDGWPLGLNVLPSRLWTHIYPPALYHKLQCEFLLTNMVNCAGDGGRSTCDHADLGHRRSGAVPVPRSSFLQVTFLSNKSGLIVSPRRNQGLI